jgi:hypothetical protein
VTRKGQRFWGSWLGLGVEDRSTSSGSVVAMRLLRLSPTMRSPSKIMEQLVSPGFEPSTYLSKVSAIATVATWAHFHLSIGLERFLSLDARQVLTTDWVKSKDLVSSG